MTAQAPANANGARTQERSKDLVPGVPKKRNAIGARVMKAKMTATQSRFWTSKSEKNLVHSRSWAKTSTKRR